LVQAIEEREATAQTIVDAGFAMPHAIIDWDGDYRVVLGRSRQGVDYGVQEAGKVHLIALFVIGRRRQAEFHLEILKSLAELFAKPEFRAELVAAKDVKAIEQLLRSRVGIMPADRPRRTPALPRLNAILIRQAVELVQQASGQALLICIDRTDSIPWDALQDWNGKLLLIVSQSSDDPTVNRADTHLLDVPHASLTRHDQAHLGLLSAAAKGLLSGDDIVVCVTGPGGRQLDSITVSKPQAKWELMFGGKKSGRGFRIKPAVLLRAMSLAIEIAAEGREGKSVGTLFIVGDSRKVVRHTQQLVLNPFHGYGRSLRNIVDPSLTETIKEFAHLDGAFVVDSGGQVLSAGTYLIPRTPHVKLPSGLGTRHQAAAAISAHTRAVAIVVSQSTGTVTVFRRGQIVLTLERALPTRS
jgi:mannitol/fructose-specific phosphotransferase system IIA component (Ntr-type)